MLLQLICKKKSGVGRWGRAGLMTPRGPPPCALPADRHENVGRVLRVAKLSGHDYAWGGRPAVLQAERCECSNISRRTAARSWTGCCSVSASSRSTWARYSPARSSGRWAAPAARGLTLAGRYMQGWFDYLRGDDRSTVNVTLNMIVDNHLKFDTLVADRRIWYVWPNAYRVQMIRRGRVANDARQPGRAVRRRFARAQIIAGTDSSPLARAPARHGGELEGRRERQDPARAPDP